MAATLQGGLKMKKVFAIAVLGLFSLLLAQSTINVPGLAGTGTRYGLWAPSGKGAALTLGSANQISGVNAAGTGIENKAFTISTAGLVLNNLLFTDATYDMGASGATRPRDLFLSRNAVIGGTINGSGVVTLSNSSAAAGTLLLSSTTAGNGLTIGADVNLYRSAANILKTDDALTVASDFRADGNSAMGGSAVNTAYVLNLNTTAGAVTAGTAQYGQVLDMLPTSAATVFTGGLWLRTRSATAAYTVTDMIAIKIQATVLGVGSAITNNYGLYVQDMNVGGTLNYAIYTNAGLVRLGDVTDATNATTAGVTSAGGIAAAKGIAIGTNLRFGANILASATASTISSGFGTSPSIASNNGTAAFTVNVGTGGVATSGVIGLPTVTTGWHCFCEDRTTYSATVFMCRQTAFSTSSATIGQFTNAAVAQAWTASDILKVSCFAY